jgi:Putative DNA-binding domain
VGGFHFLVVSRGPINQGAIVEGPYSEGSLRLGVTKIDKFYNPFDREFDEFTSEDLEVLKTVSEGWYVEYKREVPSASAIAKSITAFANTYGGWVFYGISEKSKAESVAGDFPGISIEDADAFLQRIRQAVANSAQPTPFYRARHIRGPVESIGLLRDRCVIAVQVPWGNQAPYVHRDGRIYRRVGDGSEPTAENDRFVLDQLWRRSSKVIQDYAEWTERDLELENHEKGNAFIRVFLISDFWHDSRELKVPSIEKMRSLIADPGAGYRIPFESIYRSVDGLVCRQTTDNNPELMGLTWRIKYGLQSEIVIPITKYKGEISELIEKFSGYQFSHRFLQNCIDQGFKNPAILDLNAVFILLVEIARIKLDLLESSKWSKKMSVKIQMTGVSRSIPFFDSEQVVEECIKNGMPFALQDKISIFEGRDRDSFTEMSLDGATPNARRIWLTMNLFASIASALGVRHGLDISHGAEAVTKSVNEFVDAGDRAMTVLQRRKREGHI